MSILSNEGKKIKKKKTSTQKATMSPTYNEEIVFTNLKKEKLNDIQIQFSVYQDSITNREALGFITIGPLSKGSEYNQWKDMYDGKKSIAWWQALRPESSIPNADCDSMPTQNSVPNSNSSSNSNNKEKISQEKSSKSSINSKLKQILSHSSSVNR